MFEAVIQAVIPAHLLDEYTKYHINPTGRFVIGGPMAIPTDRPQNYRGYLWRDGTARRRGVQRERSDKVDRSAAYMARHIAKNIVAGKLADRCEVQLAYAIGVPTR